MKVFYGMVCCAGLLWLAGGTSAQTNVVTDPVGFITLNAEGTNTSVRYTFMSLGMTRDVVSRGLVTGVSGTHITVSDTLTDTLTSGAFNQSVTGSTTNPVAFIEITSGATTNIGLMDDIVSNDTSSVFTDWDISSKVSSGQTYKIYQHWTIGAVFGATNDVGLTGGSSAANADYITVFDPATQAALPYYYKNSGIGGTGWRLSGSSDNQSNAVLYVDQGFYIARRSANPSNISLKIVGGVKVGPTIVPVAPQVSFIGNVYPASATLGVSGLYTTNSATGLLGGSSAANADYLAIWNQSAQSFDIYYYKNSGLGGTGWRMSGSANDASNTPINVGTMMRIFRQGSTGFNWQAQQPFVLP